MAPAQGLSKETHEAMFADSLRLTGIAKHLCTNTTILPSLPPSLLPSA